MGQRYIAATPGVLEPKCPKCRTITRELQSEYKCPECGLTLPLWCGEIYGNVSPELLQRHTKPEA